MKRFFNKLRWYMRDAWTILAILASMLIIIPMLLLIKLKEYRILSDNDYEDYDED